MICNCQVCDISHPHELQNLHCSARPSTMSSVASSTMTLTLPPAPPSPSAPHCRRPLQGVRFKLPSGAIVVPKMASSDEYNDDVKGRQHKVHRSASKWTKADLDALCVSYHKNTNHTIIPSSKSLDMSRDYTERMLPFI